MKKQWQKLKDQPDHQKQRTVRIMAIIGTAIIVLLWIVFRSLGPRTISPETTPESPNFFQKFGDILRIGRQGINDVQKDLREQSSFSEMIQEAEKKSKKDTTAEPKDTTTSQGQED